MSSVQAVAWEKHDAFLQAVHEFPDDDAPRLIYADWLEESGDLTWAAYAEFIRIQVESAKLNNRSKNRTKRLAARQQQLLAAHAPLWLGPWADAPFRWIYQRGIPELLHARATGDWIGKRLGADCGFPDRVEFSELGRIRLDYGDINWPGAWPTVEGKYQVRFTFARVQVAVELWKVKGRLLRFEGEFTDGGLRMELRELSHTQTTEPECVRLDLKAPDRWWWNDGHKEQP